jgi:hypothetical protein
MPERKRKELLRQRKVMEEKQAARDGVRREKAAVLPIRPVVAAVAAAGEESSIQGIREQDERAREMYVGLRTRLAQSGMWKGDATHGTLLTYVLCAVDIESQGVSAVPPAVLTAMAKSRDSLKLLELPPEKVSKSSRFGGW